MIRPVMAVANPIGLGALGDKLRFAGQEAKKMKRIQMTNLR